MSDTEPTPTPIPRKRVKRTEGRKSAFENQPRDPKRDDPRYEGKHVEVLRHDQGIPAMKDDPFEEGVTQFMMADSSGGMAVQYVTYEWDAAEAEEYHQTLVRAWGDKIEHFWHFREGEAGNVWIRGYFGDVYGPFVDVEAIVAWFAAQEFAIIDKRGEA